MVTAACYNEWNGLVAGHGYIVRNVYSMKRSDGTETHLIKMRNPFKMPEGQQPWTGRFAFQDSHGWTEELKQHVSIDQA